MAVRRQNRQAQESGFFAGYPQQQKLNAVRKLESDQVVFVQTEVYESQGDPVYPLVGLRPGEPGAGICYSFFIRIMPGIVFPEIGEDFVSPVSFPFIFDY